MRPPMLLYDVHTVTGTDGQPMIVIPNDGWIHAIDLHNWDNDCGPCGIAIFGVFGAERGRTDGYMQLITNVYLETNRTVGIICRIPMRQGWNIQGLQENCTAGDRSELRIWFEPSDVPFS